MRNRMLQLVICLVVVGAVVAGGLSLAAPPLKPCKWWNLNCLDVWDPVICDNGVIYSNACYAKRACATGCVPAGGGPVPVEY